VTRESVALRLLRTARRAIVDQIVDAVIEDYHLAEHGELRPYTDSVTEAGERLFELNRTIFALEDAIEKPVKPEPKPPRNPWVHSETT
jgi:hypothetical protein